MNQRTETDETGAAGGTPGRDVPYHRQTQDYGDGHIQARHGRINGWLLAVYLVMLVWALYYGYTYWGGLGPGLDLSQ